MTESALAGRRVMVVEDEVLVAMLIEDILADEQCVVLGPYGDLDEALRAGETEQMDMALLDMNLRGRLSLPLADLLARRGIPFLLLTGYGEAAGRMMTAKPHPWPICAKPFTSKGLVSAMAGLVPPVP